RVNLPLARKYHAALSELAKAVGLASSDVPLAVLAQLRDVLIVGEPEKSGEMLFEDLRPGLEAALDELIGMRKREGQALARDLDAHVVTLVRLASEMGSLARAAPAEYRKKLEERLARMVPAGEVDKQRLAQEVALLADRVDISEEIVRVGA